MNNGLQMGVKDYFMLMLEFEKNMSNNYSYAMNEASSDDLYEDFFDMFTSVKDMARDIYSFLTQNGWYPVQNVEENKVNQEAQKLCDKLQKLEQEN